MIRTVTCVVLLFLPGGCAAQPPADRAPETPRAGASGSGSALTLEQIMADPDWIGNAPERPYWSDDGRSIYYSVKRAGSEARDLMHLALDGERARVVPDSEKGSAGTPGGDWSSDYARRVYTRAGDLFLKEIASGTVLQLTRTAEAEFDPRFMLGDRRIAFRRAGAILIRDLDTGAESQAADLQAADDPDQKKDEDAGYLKSQQERLFDIVKERERRQEEAKERERAERDADPTRPPRPWYLGADMDVRDSSLSPDGRWMLVRLAKKGSPEGRRDAMPQYVSETGYVESRQVRSKVGTGKPSGESLVLLDLEKRERKDLDLSALPGINDDPLKQLRDAAEKRRKAEKAKADGETRAVDDKQGEPPEPAPDQPAQPLNDENAPEKKDQKPRPRPVAIRDIEWSEDGSGVVVQIYSLDNKDRWIVSVDLAGAALVPLERDTDDAWINGRFTALGWLKDNRTIWFLSERTGYSHLYLRDTEATSSHDPGLRTENSGPNTQEPPQTSRPLASSPLHSSARALTSGSYEVSDVEPTRDTRFLYYTANADHPGEHETWRVDTASGESQQLTFLRGRTDFVLSPDARQLLLTHSTATRPPELFVQAAQPDRAPRRLTSCVSEAFATHPWIEPQYVEIPGRAGPIHARLYLPPASSGQNPGLRAQDPRPRTQDPGPSTQHAASPEASRLPAVPARSPAVAGRGEAGRGDRSAQHGPRPAVLFIHGAGYLQNAHKGWSRYFREMMFHNLLAQRGYVVLDMDFRASSGYGRHWRTAIYRQMGTPEIEDLEDGVRWLAEHHGVDPARVGCYGGSYGGFLTLMALFTKPDLFACGAALRPVTDWAHYSDGYTANILNTPEVDPEAYERSSPIEFAAGLNKPLLICHGMQDDNVFFQDTVRLAQRLIELGKEDWEVAMYPIEPHAFTEPSSWLDEYRRVLKLFERYLCEHKP